MDNIGTQDASLVKIEGIVERVNFHSEETGFTVLKVKAKGFIELITVVGHASSVSPGEHLTGWGEWVHNKDYGQQLKAKAIKLVPPNTIEGIEKYLCSGAIKGIGPHFASKLVFAFGDKVFEIIEKEPRRLLEIEKFGEKRLAAVTAAWKESCTVRDIMVFLQSHGVSTSKAVKIYKTYGEDAIEKVRANPYQLARDISGVGFKSADVIATHLGIDKKSMLRACAGLSYVLYERINNGHCAYPYDQLLHETEELLGIDGPILTEAINEEIKAGHLVEETIESFRCIYPRALHRIEQEVAELLLELRKGPTPWPYPTDIDQTLIATEKSLKLSLAPLQKLAIHTALLNKVCVITGGPGTGKSTLTKALIHYLDSHGVRMTLCSPTGRASKRLSECTSREAKTIHRTLSFDPSKREFKFNQYNYLETDFVLIDEASMVDIQLAQSLLKAIPPHAALVIVGDIDQLPSVGPGQFLSDIIYSETIPVVKLSQIFRQAAESQIIQVAHKINSGEMPDLKPNRHGDFFFLEKNSPEETAATIIQLVSQRLPKTYNYDPLRDIQILSPMQKGSAGARNLNFELQKALNGQPIAKIERFGYTYGVGDKVIVTENDYEKEVFNGDIGFISTIDQEEQIARVSIDDRIVEFEFSDLDILQPAYTITIHKSQGSEYPVVIIPLVTQHYVMLQKNLVYTGITRGKKLVILVGQKKALTIALQSTAKHKRWTKLKERLKAALSLETI
ncbi:MAG: ATP-dependent RecD-like helicase [Pseudomonadota bacterium]|jgi:exodeoxyribonuclease V alpha subunit